MSYAASHRSNAEIPAGVNARRDYNAEGRRLVEALGLQVGGNYNAMDAIWKESSTGGKIYVGNETAARGPASTLAEHGITHVVNCTDDMPNYHENNPGGPTYLRFDVAMWHRHTDATDGSACKALEVCTDGSSGTASEYEHTVPAADGDSRAAL